MTCSSCGYEFCWLCGDKYTPDHYSYRRLTACSGRLMTNSRSSGRCANICSSLCFMMIFCLVYLMLPVIVLLCMLFSLPINAVIKRIEKNRGHGRLFTRGNGRRSAPITCNEWCKATGDVGFWKLVGLGLLSIIVFPFMMLLGILYYAAFLLIWLIFFFLMTFNFCYFICTCCCRRRPQNHRR